MSEFGEASEDAPLFSEQPAVLQFRDEDTGELRAEYVRADLYDAVVAGWDRSLKQHEKGDGVIDQAILARRETEDERNRLRGEDAGTDGRSAL